MSVILCVQLKFYFNQTAVTIVKLNWLDSLGNLRKRPMTFNLLPVVYLCKYECSWFVHVKLIFYLNLILKQRNNYNKHQFIR